MGQLERINGIINLKAHLKDAIFNSRTITGTDKLKQQFFTMMLKTHLYPIHFNHEKLAK